MDKLADDYHKQNVGSIFIYTHEAHPAENYPHHTSIEQKMNHATQFKDYFNVQRPILVDSLDGKCHRAYGSMPNMSWIFDRRGRPVYKSDWTRAESIRNAIQHLFEATERRRKLKLPFVPYNVQRMEYRPRDQEAFMNALARNGEKAVEEFKVQMKKWKKRRK